MRRLEPGTGGVVAVRVLPCGQRRPVAECACCGQVRTVRCRGLCEACRRRHAGAGTLGQYGRTRADRVAEYAAHRARGLHLPEAARRAGITDRTAYRYEAALREAA